MIKSFEIIVPLRLQVDQLPQRPFPRVPPRIRVLLRLRPDGDVVVQHQGGHVRLGAPRGRALEVGGGERGHVGAHPVDDGARRLLHRGDQLRGEVVHRAAAGRVPCAAGRVQAPRGLLDGGERGVEAGGEVEGGGGGAAQGAVYECEELLEGGVLVADDVFVSDEVHGDLLLEPVLVELDPQQGLLHDEAVPVGLVALEVVVADGLAVRAGQQHVEEGKEGGEGASVNDDGAPDLLLLVAQALGVVRLDHPHPVAHDALPFETPFRELVRQGPPRTRVGAGVNPRTLFEVFPKHRVPTPWIRNQGKMFKKFSFFEKFMFHLCIIY